MNLEAAIASSELRRNSGHTTGMKQERQSIEVARRVFEVSAMANEPYENLKPEEWVQRWLASQTFVLAEIAPHHVAVPNVNRINKNKIQATLQCSAEEIEPIVVDLNKQNIGATNSGFVPKIIVVDGKHRHRAQVLRGKDRILAWVGDQAMAELQKRNSAKQFVIKAAAKPLSLSRFSATKLDILAAIAGPAAAMTRQDAGDGGSRPTGGTQVPKMASMGGGMGGPGASATGGSGMNPTRKGIFSQNARSSGSLEEPDPSDTKAEPDPSDRNKTFPDPSDRLQWKANKPQKKAPGADYKPFKWLDQGGHSAGSGVGPRINAYGTSEGVLNAKKKKRMEAGPIRVKKIVTSPKGQK